MHWRRKFDIVESHPWLRSVIGLIDINGKKSLEKTDTKELQIWIRRYVADILFFDYRTFDSSQQIALSKKIKQENHRSTYQSLRFYCFYHRIGRWQRKFSAKISSEEVDIQDFLEYVNQPGILVALDAIVAHFTCGLGRLVREEYCGSSFAESYFIYTILLNRRI